jgi:predicted nuclease of predicted toxin-antitoxin system
VHFLTDASMPRSTAPLIQSRGHDATDVRDIGLGTAQDDAIAAHAQAQKMAILSRDFDFADIQIYPPDQYAGIVVVDLPCTTTASTSLNLVDAFLGQTQTLNDLPGRLAIIEPGRTRLRPRPEVGASKAIRDCGRGEAAGTASFKHAP